MHNVTEIVVNPCNMPQVMVLMSGSVLVHAEGRPPVRLQPGVVLGVEPMLRRQASPLTVTSDPHFEAHMAVLSWEQYNSALRAWAAQKLVALVPDLQVRSSTCCMLRVASITARISEGCMHHDEPLCKDLQPAMYSLTGTDSEDGRIQCVVPPDLA